MSRNKSPNFQYWLPIYVSFIYWINYYIILHAGLNEAKTNAVILPYKTQNTGLSEPFPLEKKVSAVYLVMHAELQATLREEYSLLL